MIDITIKSLCRLDVERIYVYICMCLGVEEDGYEHMSYEYIEAYPIWLEQIKNFYRGCNINTKQQQTSTRKDIRNKNHTAI